jgi:hypothetical protein
MTEAENEKLDQVIKDSTNQHFYTDDGRSVARYTKTACGYAIWNNVTTSGDEQLDMDRAMASLDEKEEVYLAKLIKWGKIE